MGSRGQIAQTDPLPDFLFRRDFPDDLTAGLHAGGEVRVGGGVRYAELETLGLGRCPRDRDADTGGSIPC